MVLGLVNPAVRGSARAIAREPPIDTAAGGSEVGTIRRLPTASNCLRGSRRWRLLTTAAAFALLGGCATPATPREGDPPSAASAAMVAVEPAPLDTAVAIETFDVVWRTVDGEHFHRGFDAAAWVAVRDELRPRAETVKSNAELRRLLDEMLARLGQSHFAIIPGALADGGRSESAETEEEEAGDAGDAESGDLGVEFRLIERRIVAVGVRADGPAALAGVRSGWELVALDGKDLRIPPAGSDADAADAGSASLARLAVESYAAQRPATSAGRTRTFVFLDEAGAQRSVELTARAAQGERVRFGNLPPFRTRVEDRSIESGELLAAGVAPGAIAIGYIGFNVWMIPAARALDEAIDRHREADGVILDLRGNPGGLGGMAMGVGGHFLAEPKSLGTMITSQGELEFRVNPRRVTADGRLVEPFAGPLAILVDPLTASTSEIFTAGLQELGRARVFGQTSAGAALPSIATRLPNGDVFLYAMADFVTPKGRRIEGQGVVPDVPVDLTRNELLAEGDPVLRAAIRWIAENATATTGHAAH